MAAQQPVHTEVRHTYADADPTTVRVTEVKESSAAWWVGGLVAIVAILAVVFLVTRNPNADAEVANAVEQGRLQGALESTQTTLGSTQDAARMATEALSNQSRQLSDSARLTDTRIRAAVAAAEANLLPAAADTAATVLQQLTGITLGEKQVDEAVKTALNNHRAVQTANAGRA